MCRGLPAAGLSSQHLVTHDSSRQQLRLSSHANRRTIVDAYTYTEKISDIDNKRQQTIPWAPTRGAPCKMDGSWIASLLSG